METQTNGGLETAEDVAFGKWGARLRAVCGLIAVCTICFLSYTGMEAATIAVKSGHPWPDKFTLVALLAGPMAIAWQYMSVNKLLSLLFSSDVMDRTTIKDRVKAFMDPKNVVSKEVPKST